MGLWKPTKRHKTWYVRFTDHQGIPRRIRGAKTRTDSLSIERKINALVNAARAGENPPLEILDWIAHGLDPETREKLIEFELLRTKQLTSSTTLSGHVDAWKASLINKGRPQAYADRVAMRVNALFGSAGFEQYNQIEIPRVFEALAILSVGNKQTRKKAIRPAGQRQYLRACKMFTSWMDRFGGATDDRLRRLALKDIKVGDSTRPRRALSEDELTRLLEVTPANETRYDITGDERALLYWTAVETGLRAKELSLLKAADFVLGVDHPHVLVRKGLAKNNKDARQLMSPNLAAKLKAHLAKKMPEALAFKMPRDLSHMARLMRHDLTQAAIPVQTSAGVIDFHALRHTCGTRLARAGVHPSTAQKIMRHSSIDLTMKFYTHPDADAAVDAMAAVAALKSVTKNVSPQPGNKQKQPPKTDKTRKAKTNQTA